MPMISQEDNSARQPNLFWPPKMGQTKNDSRRLWQLIVMHWKLNMSHRMPQKVRTSLLPTNFHYFWHIYTTGYIVSPSSMVCVTTLPHKILTLFYPCLYMFTTTNTQ